jgi:signal transduction histidine kinase
MNAALSLPLTLSKKKTAVTEAQWVRSESIRHVMASVVNTQLLMFCAMVSMAALLYGHASTPTLLAWFIMNSILSSLRLWLLRGYAKSDQANHVAERAIFFQRYARLAPFNGFIWGVSIFLFNGIPTPNIAIFCLIVVLIFGMFSVSNLSSHLRLMNRFIWAYCAGLLSAVLLYIAIEQNFFPDTVQLWYLAMIAIFVYMQFSVGMRMNSTYIEGLKLQFRNRKLIASLTEQRETALAAVATKNRMLASAAHDMRQPVLALDLYAGWLVDDPAASIDIAPKIAASTKAVIGLFDSLFDMSRLTEGLISTNLEAVNLNELLSALYTQYQPIAKSKNLSLRTRVIQGTVFTDHILLERILGNLISNALKYTEKGGVLLACRHTARGVKLEVWDTGVCIAPDQQTLVFKEFYKSPSNNGTTDGFGLGLAIVSQLAELLGFELTMRSRLNHGTVVTIQFPTPASISTNAAKNKPPNLKKVKDAV